MTRKFAFTVVFGAIRKVDIVIEAENLRQALDDYEDIFGNELRYTGISELRGYLFVDDDGD